MDRPLPLDGTVAVALQDVQTVTSAGRSVAPVIEGVLLHSPANHVDHRGRVFEVYPGESAFWHEPVVYCYAWTVRAATSKGWGLHREKDDRYTLISGEALTVLFDARMDSPTHGMVQKVPLSPQGTRQILIPRGVWHITLNLSTTETFLINHPTRVYRHEAPDRLLLPWDSPAIPVDLAALFPTQWNGDESGDCG
jgi:dTDP-4-dehydrorhamnose 3,5-epimerase